MGLLPPAARAALDALGAHGAPDLVDALVLAAARLAYAQANEWVIWAGTPPPIDGTKRHAWTEMKGSRARQRLAAHTAYSAALRAAQAAGPPCAGLVNRPARLLAAARLACEDTRKACNDAEAQYQSAEAQYKAAAEEVEVVPRVQQQQQQQATAATATPKRGRDEAASPQGSLSSPDVASHTSKRKRPWVELDALFDCELDALLEGFE
jgi:hypothetical protein